MRDIAGSVAIIATERDGDRFGMAATSVVSLSMEPPSIVFCLNRNASLYAPLVARGAACVNVLSKDQAALCGIFSGKEKGSARFDHGRWICGTGRLPMLEGARQVLFVRTQEQFQFGTHAVFSGEVTDVRTGGGASPLVYLDGSFVDISNRVENGIGD